MKKFFKILAVLFLVLILSVLFGKNIIVKLAAEQGYQAFTGMPLRIAKLDISWTKTYVSIAGLEIGNPAGFPDRLLADVPEIYVDYDLPALLKGKIHLREVRFNLKEFAVIRNKEGVMNLDKLKSLQQAQKPGAGAKPKESAPKKEIPPPQIQIDVLVLKVGQVVYKDYSGGSEPSVKQYNVGLDKEIKNITDLYALGQTIVFQALLKTPLANLPELNMKGLEKTLTGTVGTVTDLTSGVVNTATDTLKKTTDSILKLPFKKE